MSTEIQFRLTGTRNDVQRLLDGLKDFDGVESATEVADLMTGMAPDSSSAQAPDEVGPGQHQVRVELSDPDRMMAIRNALRDLAVRRNVAIEFVEPV